MPIRKHLGIHQTGGKTGKLRKGYKYTGKKTKTGLSIIKKINKKKTTKKTVKKLNKKTKQHGGVIIPYPANQKRDTVSTRDATAKIEERLYHTIDTLLIRAIQNVNEILANGTSQMNTDTIIAALILCSRKDDGFGPDYKTFVNNLIIDIRAGRFVDRYNDVNRVKLVVSGGKCLPFYAGTKAMLELTPTLFSFDYDMHLICRLHEHKSNYGGIERPEPYINLNKKDDIIVNSLLVYYLIGYGWTIADFSKIM